MIKKQRNHITCILSLIIVFIMYSAVSSYDYSYRSIAVIIDCCIVIQLKQESANNYKRGAILVGTVVKAS